MKPTMKPTVKPTVKPSVKRAALIAAVRASRPGAFPHQANTRQSRAPVPTRWRCPECCQIATTPHPCQMPPT